MYLTSESKQKSANDSLRDLQQRLDVVMKDNSRLKEELNEEQTRVKENKRLFARQLREHQRASENHMKTIREKDLVIEELRSKRLALEAEVENLRREWDKLKADYKKVQREKESIKQDFQASNTMIADLQRNYEVIKREKITIEDQIRIIKEIHIREIKEKELIIKRVSTAIRSFEVKIFYSKEVFF